MDPNTKTLLLVDDDEGMRDFLSAILKRDYRVRVVATGEEVLTVLKKEDIDLILLDVKLPGINASRCSRSRVRTTAWSR